MQSLRDNLTEADSLTCYTVEPCIDIPSLEEDVRDGLLDTPRSLPPKYFYDERGSELFDEICNTEEYYPTRTEEALLSVHAEDIISATLADEIIELGSGTSRKTRLLFDACETLRHHCVYTPFDVCEPMLLKAGHELIERYKWLEVRPLLGDYHAGLTNLPTGIGTKLFLFLGSTIGNFEPDEAFDFITDIRACMSRGDHLLIGADRVKDTEVLNLAYNDDAGITADFNLNVLNVLNEELDANFETANFRHHAYFNEELGRIEMHLISSLPQSIEFRSMNKEISLQKNESILTEVSHKFHSSEIEKLLIDCGFEIAEHYEPENRYFSLLLAKAN